MSSGVLRLVLLVSCCHGLVHIYEHSFASVEQLVGQEFGVGKETTGLIGSCFRLPFGLCALAAGWLADRWGARRLLLGYVIGCAISSWLAWLWPSLEGVFLAMFLLGVFAGIYHPAGIGWIAQQTQPENRPLALGYHGILGSVGIAAGPFLAAFVLQWGVSWRIYYLVLGLVGGLLAWLLALSLPRQQPPEQTKQPLGLAESRARRTGAGNPFARVDHPERLIPGTLDASNLHSSQPVLTPVGFPRNSPTECSEQQFDSWRSFWMLSAMTSLAGMVYAAITTFLPRYLDETGLSLSGVSAASMRNYQAGFVLVLGVVGQYTAGRVGRPHSLEPLLALAFGLAAPCVVWMGFAKGLARLVAAGLFAVLFFAHQPLYNSAVAKYIAAPRRGLAYGIAFTLGFGFGSLGPAVAGRIPMDEILYPILGSLLALAAILALLLWQWHRRPTAEPLRPQPLGQESAFL
ncbi:MAG: MFS transporter [Thermoguttaceae bacterium]|nr:MFS transporter [Thermoguttaceae bacterium]MDW8036931.1 MFS transporter [Thermoguttaceae bacterium]